MSDISNKTLAILVGIAIVISLVGILSISKGGVTYITGAQASNGSGVVQFNASSETVITVSGAINFGSGRVNKSASSATLNTYDATNTGADVATGQNLGLPNWVNTSTWSRYIQVVNEGTVNISVGLKADGNNNAAGFIGGTTPSFQMRGITTESGSCAGTLSETYTDVPNATETAYTICPLLQYAVDNDEFNVSAKVVVPSDAASGPRNATITFTGTAV